MDDIYFMASSTYRFAVYNIKSGLLSSNPAPQSAGLMSLQCGYNAQNSFQHLLTANLSCPSLTPIPCRICDGLIREGRAVSGMAAERRIVLFEGIGMS